MNGFVKSLLISSALVSVMATPSLEAGRKKPERHENGFFKNTTGKGRVLPKARGKYSGIPKFIGDFHAPRSTRSSAGLSKSEVSDGATRSSAQAGAGSSITTLASPSPASTSASTVTISPVLSGSSITSPASSVSGQKRNRFGSVTNEPHLEAKRLRPEAMSEAFVTLLDTTEIEEFLREYGIQDELPVRLARPSFKKIIDSGKLDKFKVCFKIYQAGSNSLGVHTTAFRALIFYWITDLVNYNYDLDHLKSKPSFPLDSRVRAIRSYYHVKSLEEYVKPLFMTYQYFAYQKLPFGKLAAPSLPETLDCEWTEAHYSRALINTLFSDVLWPEAIRRSSVDVKARGELNTSLFQKNPVVTEAPETEGENVSLYFSHSP